MKLNDIEIFPRAKALLPVAWNHFSALLPAARHMFFYVVAIAIAWALYIYVMFLAD